MYEFVHAIRRRRPQNLRLKHQRVHYLCIMSQLQRLISILTLLKSKRLLTATELSEKFEVSIRTIYRDIRKLEESGMRRWGKKAYMCVGKWLF